MVLPYSLPDDPNNPGGTGGGGGTPTTYGTIVFDKNFTKLDAASALDIIVYMNCSNVDDLRFSAYLFIDEVLQQVGSNNFLFDQSNSNAQGTMTLAAIIEGIAAGAHNCRVRVKNRETEGPLIVQGGSLLKISELRQAGR
jgi:alkyl hydroperoxide reductase subunit AhpF